MDEVELFDLPTSLDEVELFDLPTSLDEVEFVDFSKVGVGSFIDRIGISAW